MQRNLTETYSTFADYLEISEEERERLNIGGNCVHVNMKHFIQMLESGREVYGFICRNHNNVPSHCVLLTHESGEWIVWDPIFCHFEGLPLRPNKTATSLANPRVLGVHSQVMIEHIPEMHSYRLTNSIPQGDSKLKTVCAFYIPEDFEQYLFTNPDVLARQYYGEKFAAGSIRLPFGVLNRWISNSGDPTTLSIDKESGDPIIVLPSCRRISQEAAPDLFEGEASKLPTDIRTLIKHMQFAALKF